VSGKGPVGHIPFYTVTVIDACFALEEVISNTRFDFGCNSNKHSSGGAPAGGTQNDLWNTEIIHDGN